MLRFAEDEAESLAASIVETIWVPGSMETRLALERLLQRQESEGAVALGIIERGETLRPLPVGMSRKKEKP